MLVSSAFDPSCVSSCATSQVISSDSRVAAPGDRHFDKRPRRESCARWGKGVLALVVLCLVSLSGFAPSAEAQTAHFTGAVATSSTGGSLSSVAVDRNGNVFFADVNSNTVNEILAVNGTIPASPTINTLGSGFSVPYAVAVDGAGNVFVANQGNHLLQEILAVNGTIPANPTINTLGSGFNQPVGIAVDAAGNVFVADTTNGVQEIVAVSGSIPASNPTINTLGSGFNQPVGIAVDAAGNVFVADKGDGTVLCRRSSRSMAAYRPATRLSTYWAAASTLPLV
jgi:sugar lactone lactonase YvrE